MKLPSVSVGRLSGKNDALVGKVLLLAILICLIVSVVLRFVNDEPYYIFAPLLSIPILGYGVLALLTGRRFVYLVATVVATVLVAVFDYGYAVVVLFVLLGSVGISAVAGLVQRLGFYPMVRAVERCHSGPKVPVASVLAQFFFCIPDTVEPRDLHIERAVVRRELPFRNVVDSAFIALAPCLVMWILMYLFVYVWFGGIRIHLAAYTVLMYSVLLALIPSVLSTARVRIGESFRLYDGLVMTFKRMDLVLAIVVVLVMVLNRDCTEGMILLVATIIVGFVILVMASAFYYLGFEGKAIDSISGRWNDFRPVDMYEGLGPESTDKKDEGVPGTPVRKKDL